MTQNCDADSVPRVALEQLADEVSAEHQAGLKRQREDGRPSVYHGLRSNQSRRRRYKDAQYVKVKGAHARLLDQYEIAEFRWAIDRIIERRNAECV